MHILSRDISRYRRDIHIMLITSSLLTSNPVSPAVRRVTVIPGTRAAVIFRKHLTARAMLLLAIRHRTDITRDTMLIRRWGTIPRQCLIRILSRR